VTNGTRWVGIDLHRRRSHVAVIDEQGELTASRRIVNDRGAFLELLGAPEGKTHVAIEATYGWEWLAELLETPAMTCTSRTRCARARSPPPA
jgi:Transposase